MWRFVCYIFDFLKVQNPLFKGLFTSLMAEIAHSGIFILSVSAHILAKNAQHLHSFGFYLCNRKNIL